ncbi:MAG: phenylacetate--CoA ligase family protein [Chloroflexia bacterium]
MYWNSEIETMPRERLEALQLERLRAAVAEVYERVPFFRESFDRTGVRPSDLRSMEDLSNFPFTRKSDLRDHYPFGLFARPLDQVARIHGSSGTKGKPTIVGYTRHDIDTWAEVCARSLMAAGARPGDVVHNAYGYGLFTGGLGIHYGAEKMGCTVVPMSGGNTPRQVMLLQDFGARILACTPSYALNIADHLLDAGIAPGDLKLGYGVFGAEPWTKEMRDEIERRLSITALDIYGLSEIIGPGVSTECHEGKNGLHVWEDHFLVEIVDPDTGDPVPEGQEGELTFTSLTKEAFPLVRYRTGDICSFTTEPCPCGRTHGRMSRVKGRADDMLVIRGVNVFPSEIERVLLTHRELSPYYRIIVDRSASMPRLEVDAEVKDEFFDSAGGDTEQKYLNSELPDVVRLGQRIEAGLASALSLHARVNLKAPGSVPRSEGKAVRVVERK